MREIFEDVVWALRATAEDLRMVFVGIMELWPFWLVLLVVVVIREI